MRLLRVLFVLALLTRGDELVLTRHDPHAAVTNAIKFFEGSREPDALVWLAWMHKRFGIQEFAGALQRYDEVLADQPQQAPLRRVLRRVADRNTPINAEDWASVVHPSDRITVSALYCDQLGFPATFAEALTNAFSQGGYYFPHVLLAEFWIHENGCTLSLPRGFVDDVYRANAAIIHNDPTRVTDLTLEAAAFLHLAGQGALVDDAFLDRVIASQNSDGGWGQAPNRPGHSDWHSSVLGLLFLAHVRSVVDSADASHLR
jgi:hypothetical protein